MRSIQRGMVFGVFDGLHDGHKHFLSSAKALCDELYVVVASDETVLTLKGRTPRYTLQERKELLRGMGDGFVIVDGDKEPGEWTVIDSYDPDRVFLGYDQGDIGRALKKQGIPCTFLDAYKPDTFKSSLLNNN